VLDSVSESTDDELLDGAKSCPTDAIIVEDDTGKQIWPEK